MIGRIGKGSFGLFVLLLLMCFPLQAAAAESTVIDKLNITIKDNYGEPGELLEPTITCSTANVLITDISFARDEWRPGTKVRTTITLEAQNGKTLSKSYNRNSCKVTGAQYVFAGANSDGQVEVKVDYMPCTILETTSEAAWDSTFTKAIWRRVEWAPGYEVNLYADDKKIDTKKVTITNIDFSQKMKDSTKTYYYEVRAIPMTTDEKKYLKEGDYVTCEDAIITSSIKGTAVTPIPSGQENYSGTSTPSPDSIAIKSNAKNGLTQDPGTGKTPGAGVALGGMQLGWQQQGKDWYYVDSNMNYARGWTVIGGSFYYFDSIGVMQTGLFRDPASGADYYLGLDGAMKTGWQMIGSDWYYFGSDGKKQTGWFYDSGKMYNLGEDGRMMRNKTLGQFTFGADGAAIR